MGALIAACITGVDRQVAIRALNSRLAEIAGADETATPLLRAVENLLDGVRRGGVSDVEGAMELVAESAAELQATPGDRLDLIERLDLMASGVMDVDLDSSAGSSMRGAGPSRSPAEGSSMRGAGPSRSPAEGSFTAEPPVLTEREDGSRVELGRFDEPSALAAEAIRDEPRTVGTIVEAMDAVVLRLSRQVETVRARSGAGQYGEVRQTVDELSETVRELEHLRDALAKWSEESAALLGGVQAR